MASPADSLDALILSQLSLLSLRSDPDTLDFIRGVVEESSFEPEDRKSAILGLLELDESDEEQAGKVEQLLEETQAYQDTMEARRAEEEAAEAAANAPHRGKKPLTPEEEAQRKADLIRQYGRIEEESDADRLAREKAERPTGKALLDPSSMNKKQRKKALDGVDLLALPNLNKHHVQEKARQQKASSSAAAQAKREKDKADLKKQKDDAAKKLADKQKKAQKGERRA
ncbi:hypothetical protein JCM10207_003684 [Rhodosporidiobolus poonsookiae]